MTLFRCCNGAADADRIWRGHLFGRSCSEKNDHAYSIVILAHGLGDRKMAHHRHVRRVRRRSGVFTSSLLTEISLDASPDPLADCECTSREESRRPSARSCTLQRSGRLIRRVRPIMVKSGGWCPCKIASTILGDKNASGRRSRT